jgi:hypothetical protein
MDTPRIDDSTPRYRFRSRSLLGTLVAVALLVGGGYLLARYFDWQEQDEVNKTELDQIVVALRETRNRLEVYRLSGTVTTKRETRGGPFDWLPGKMIAKQPWSTSYFINMRDLSLDDYIWDERTRTLLVRAPAVLADAPNIDESRQVVSYQGPIITRDMQTRLRHEIAKGARRQAMDEAAKPENLAAATQAARQALARNLEPPLRAAGLGDVSVVVRAPVDGRQSTERWDVSRSIAEVLAERAAR